MTITGRLTLPDGYVLPAFDLYRDIHKAIRAELFAVTSAAGSLDHTDHVARAAFCRHVDDVAAMLALHAEHEDVFISPVLAEHFPALAARVGLEHGVLDGSFGRIVEVAHTAVAAPEGDERRLAQLAYLRLASFTSAYLAHQELEEVEITPLLERAIGPAEMAAINGAIVSSIPPEILGRELTLMLPAMNVDDRTELLGGVRATAPAEVFAGVLGLARSVLPPADYVQLATRLGVA